MRPRQVIGAGVVGILLWGASAAHALADPGPTYRPKMRVGKFVTQAERKVLDDFRTEKGLPYEEAAIEAAYAEYKLARQMEGGYEDKAKRALERKTAQIVARKSSLYYGSPYGSPTRPSDFLGIKHDLFRKNQPETFDEVLKAFNQAWFAR